MSLSSHIRALASLSLLALGCPDPAADNSSLASYGAQNIQVNGIQLNGIQLNGIQLNGIQLNGIQLNGIQLNGIQLNGIQLNGIQLNGIQLNGVALDPRNISIKNSLLSAYISDPRKILTGSDLKGLTASLNVPDPSTGKVTVYTLRIDSVTLDTANKYKDVWLYQVSYKVDTGKTWQSLCLDDAGNPSPLIPVIGSYWNGTTGARIDDPKSFTPACREGAIGKCVSIGYRLWANGTIGSGCSSCDNNDNNDSNCSVVSLKDYHQACTRLLRADYCGDGTPHTQNGTILDIFDYLNPHVQAQEEKWIMEARWNTTGAICLSQRRHPEIPFPGCAKVNPKDQSVSYTQLPKCQPYSTGNDRGLIVSTFEPTTPAPQ